MNAALYSIARAVDRLAPVLLTAAIVGFAVLAWRLMRRPRRDPDGALRDVALAVAAAIVVIATLLTSSGLGDEAEIQLVPFTNLFDALADGRGLRQAIFELIGNAVLFIPLGMALRWRLPSAGVLAVTAIALATSVGIEVVQGLLPTGRFSNTTDVIMNTLGGAIGALLAGARALDPGDRA